MYRHILLILCVLSAATLPAWSHTAAQWIWYPEEPSGDAVDAFRWLRRSFEVPEVPRQATLWLLVDDNQRVWLNGHGPLERDEQIEATHRFDVTELLQAGRNALAVEAYNAVGPAGVLARLVMTMPDGTEQVISSDTTWKASREEHEGWTAPDFDDTQWVDARIMGHAFSRPWIGIPRFHTDPFITAAEREAYGEFMKTLLAQPEQFAEEPLNRYALRYHNGMPAMFINDQPRPAIWYRGSVDPMEDFGRRQISAFADVGIHLNSVAVAIDKCWPAPGEYDFTELDNQLRAFLSTDPQAHLLVKVRLVPPGWWMEAHPDEWVAYGTSDQLDSTDESGRVKRASIASDRWLEDTSAVWTAMIRHIENQPWGKRVMGWQPMYGIYAEWHYFGSWWNHYPDTGAAMTRRFRQYLRETYADEAALRAAWKDPNASFDTAQVPGVEPRRDSTLLTLRDPEQEQWVIDYYHCHQKVVADAIEHFCAIAKEETAGRTITGVWYGYFYGVRPQTQGGHLELERLWQSPHIDYFAAPYEYGNRLMGQDGRFRTLNAAYRESGKVCLVEADTRTFLHPREQHGRTQNLEETLAALRREALTALIEKNGYWYVDFGAASRGGWYDHPEIMAEIGRLTRLAERALQNPGRSTAEVAVIYDLESGYYLNDDLGMQQTYSMVMDNIAELYRVGIPFDTLLMSQLNTVDLSPYRLMIFVNTFQMSDVQARRIELLRRSGRHAMIFMWAPGLTGPDGVSELRASRVTGFDLSLVERMLPGEVIVTATQDPLTAGLPRQTSHVITPGQKTAVPGFADPRQWYNPRAADVMEARYESYEITPLEEGMRWRIATLDTWTDIHWRGEFTPQDGIGLDLQVDGDAHKLSIQFVIKDADMHEFAAPVVTLTDNSPRSFDWPLAAFESAPWAREPKEEPTLPLQGVKVVVRGTASNTPYIVNMSALRSVEGEVATGEIMRFGGGLFGPALIPDPDQGRPLGHISGDETLTALVASGEGLHTVLYSASTFLPREVLTAMVQQAGVHRYVTDPQVIFRGDTRFVSLHTKEGGEVRLALPGRFEVTDPITGAAVGTGEDMTLTLPPNSTTILELKPAEPEM